MKVADSRPTWPFAEVPEATFRAICKFGLIVSVKAEWEFTGVDTAREWLTATNSAGNTMTLPANWRRVMRFVGNASVPGLFCFDGIGESLVERLREIDAWEAKNKRDRSEFERLKAKFGGQT
jgi:hypothetical protein